MGNAGLLNKYRSNRNSHSSSSSSSSNTFNAVSSYSTNANNFFLSSSQQNASNSSSNGGLSNNANNSNAGGTSSNTTSLNPATPNSRSSKLIIAYDKWIKHDCKKYGHFKYFDFYNLENLNEASLQTNYQHHGHYHHQHQLSYNGSFSFSISPPNSNSNASASSSKSLSTTSSNANHNENMNQLNSTQFSNSNPLSYSNRAYSYSYSANLNQPIAASSSSSNSNSTTTQQVDSFPHASQYLPFNSIDASNSAKNSNNNNNKPRLGLIHYVNGNFFKPIERLGDSQFIISQLSFNDIVVTVPCNIERYRPNDRTTKEIATRLNRVIGVCEQFLVFQIWKGNNEVEIFIYDSKNETTDTNKSNNSHTSTTSTKSIIQESSHRIVKRLNRRFNSRTYTCLISADKNVILLTPDYENNHSYWHHSHAHSEYTLIINLNTFHLLRLIPARCDQRFAFDPRYGWPNYPAPRFAEFDTVRGQIVDLSTDKVVVCSNHTLKTKVFRVEYTRDGYLIIVVCTLPIFQRRVRRNYFIYILNSSSLLHMRSIIDYRGPLLSTYMFSTDFNLLFNIYPSISNCSSSIAVLKNIEPSSSTRVIELYSLPSVSSMSLKEICRRVILRHVDDKNLNKLPLPPKLIAYLSYNNINFGSNSNNNLAVKVNRKKPLIIANKMKKYAKLINSS